VAPTVSTGSSLAKEQQTTKTDSVSPSEPAEEVASSVPSQDTKEDSQQERKPKMKSASLMGLKRPMTIVPVNEEETPLDRLDKWEPEEPEVEVQEEKKVKNASLMGLKRPITYIPMSEEEKPLDRLDTCDEPEVDVQDDKKVDAQEAKVDAAAVGEAVTEVAAAGAIEEKGDEDGLARTLESKDGFKTGRVPSKEDSTASPEHLYYIFNLWPVLRPHLRKFLIALREQREAGHIKGIYIYTANTSVEWVKFIMTCILEYYDLPLDTFNGLKHSPGGLKIVPENAVLYDDHPENVTGNCVPVDPYYNDISWELLEPVVRCLPDDPNKPGALSAYIAKDKQFADRPHEKESEETLNELADEAAGECEKIEEVLLDLDETLIVGARISAYFFALNHFLKFNTV